MSFQRAYVNCERCYGLAKYILSDSNDSKGEDSKNNLLNSDPLYTARNEAMKALEQEKALMLERGYVEGSVKPSRCLDACVACDFSKPAIKDSIDKIWKDQKPN